MSDRTADFGRCCADLQNLEITTVPRIFWRFTRANMPPPAEAAGLFESIGPAPKLSRLDRLGTFGAGKIFRSGNWLQAWACPMCNGSDMRYYHHTLSEQPKQLSSFVWDSPTLEQLPIGHLSALGEMFFRPWRTPKDAETCFPGQQINMIFTSSFQVSVTVVGWVPVFLWVKLSPHFGFNPHFCWFNPHLWQAVEHPAANLPSPSRCDRFVAQDTLPSRPARHLPLFPFRTPPLRVHPADRRWAKDSRAFSPWFVSPWKTIHGSMWMVNGSTSVMFKAPMLNYVKPSVLMIQWDQYTSVFNFSCPWREENKPWPGRADPALFAHALLHRCSLRIRNPQGSIV